MRSIRMRLTLKFFRLIILVMLPCFFAVACGGGGGGGNDDEADEPLTTVGKNGGVVEDTNGASVVIPEGALSDSYDISIVSYLDNESLPQGVAPILEMRGAVKLAPDGLIFTKPVTVTVPVSEYMEPRTKFPLLYWNESELIWEQTAFIATVADNGMSFSADVTHFSEYGGWAIEDLIYGGTIEQFKNDFTAWFEEEYMKGKDPVAKNNECYEICGATFDLSYEINDEADGDFWTVGETEASDYSDAPLIMVDYTYDISNGHSLNGYVRITSTMHYKCTQPTFDLLVDKTILQEGEVTTVNALLQCSGTPLIGKNITFSHTGPGEINPANITTNTSGSAAATFTAGNADAVIEAFYSGCEFGDSYTLKASVPITVTGTVPITVTDNTSLNIFIESNTESGGMVITTSGTVPLSLTTNGANDTAVTGTGSLQVSGTASAGGDCSGIVSGETYVAVTGTRDAASTYDLTLILTQNAVLTVTCPKGGAVTPLIGSDAKEVTLSKSNGYLVTEQGADNGTTWVSEVSLDKP